MEVHMTKTRYLTKSRFSLATDCPTKLFYTGKNSYANQSLDDSFLMSLADGGFQVGELAKYYFPGGTEIKELDYENSLAKTKKLLEQKSVIIYEAAINFNNLFIRTDILVKDGDQLKLYEVKEKSFYPNKDNPFINNKGKIKSNWSKYIYDVAFQKHVITKAYPEYDVSAYLILADKSESCPTDGLNQKFLLTKDSSGRKSVLVSDTLTEKDLSDREELCDFIKTITQSTKKSIELWVGNRNMIDMLDVVKRYYYDPSTNGSNSIKQVLPAILNGSSYLQNKYSEPIYGSSNGIKSSNFKDWQWVRFEDGKVVDPYRLLPKMFDDVSDHDIKILSEGDELAEGGAALTAYGRMQFEDMSDYERSEIEKALLKYCELDTLAMVMIYEGWKSFIA